MDKQYKLEDASQEEMQKFKDGMDELLNKLSLNLSLIINKKALSMKMEDGKVDNVFIDQPTLLIQKKVEIAESEIVNPTQKDDITKA